VARWLAVYGYHCVCSLLERILVLIDNFAVIASGELGVNDEITAVLVAANEKRRIFFVDRKCFALISKPKQ
jgi:hypothetical protein